MFNRLFFALLSLALAGCVAPKANEPAAARPSPAPPAQTGDCHCGEQSHGITMKGRVVAVLPQQGELRVTVDEIPGIMPAGAHDFKAAPEVLAAVQPGREILAQIEQRRGEWWMFDVRLLLRRPAAP